MASYVEAEQKSSSTEYSILVVGFTGVGKSSFCNFFSRTKLFNEFEGIFEESANDINGQTCEIVGVKLTIVDCPGFGDTEKSMDEYYTEIMSFLNLQKISVDIIILVINITRRFSQEESELIRNISNLLEDFWENVFCVFTHADFIEKHVIMKQTDCSDKTFDYIEHIKNSPKTSQELKDLLNLVKERYICIESVNKSDDKDYWALKANTILESFQRIKENKAKRQKEKEKKVCEREEIKTKTDSKKVRYETMCEKGESNSGSEPNETKEIIALEKQNEIMRDWNSTQTQATHMHAAQFQAGQMLLAKQMQEMQAAQLQATQLQGKQMQDMQAAQLQENQLQRKQMQEMQAAQMQTTQLHEKQMKDMQIAHLEAKQTPTVKCCVM